MVFIINQLLTNKTCDFISFNSGLSFSFSHLSFFGINLEYACIKGLIEVKNIDEHICLIVICILCFELIEVHCKLMFHLNLLLFKRTLSDC